jgi:hypothetical protein
MTQRILFNCGIYVKTHISFTNTGWKVESACWPSYVLSNPALFRLTFALESPVRRRSFHIPLTDAFRQGTLKRKQNRDRLDKFLRSLETQ